jgi:hypothetical protein
MKNKILKKNKNNGFVLLYTMIVSSIILAVALGIVSVALKETQFSTSAKATNEAFFAADTGAECALFYDKTTNNAFNDPSIEMNCAYVTVNRTFSGNTWSFSLGYLGDSLYSCANVTLTRDAGKTTVISKGYNKASFDGSYCNPVSNSVERELKVTY